MGQNATTPQSRNSGTVHCDRNCDAPSYKTALKLQICKKKSTFGGFLLKIGVSRDRQTWKRVLILSCRFLGDGFENRVEITKFVDNFVLFQENSNN